MEEWRDVKGWEGLYRVSNLGNVYSIRSKKLLKFSLNRGYPSVVFSTIGERKWARVHRLVAKAFIPNPNNLPQINHIDGCKTNNAVSNMEWCSARHNLRHALDTGLRKGPIGTKHGLSKLNDEKVKQIRTLASNGLSQKRLAKMFGVNQSLIYTIVSRKIWKHVQ